MMPKMFLLCCLITVCRATFFHVTMPVAINSTTMNVCIYSADPNKYDPKCFVCQNIVYPHALEACLNVSTMPNNVSYDQANCIEKNCDINYPTEQQQSTSKFEPMVDLLKAKESSSKLGSLVDLLKSKFSKRSADKRNLAATDDDNGLLQLLRDSIWGMDNIFMQRVDTYASDQGFNEEDY